MLKHKITTKRVKGIYSYVIQVPYCDAQELLKGLAPVAYHAGSYGWNYDLYEVEVGSVVAAICTGYRSMPGILAERTNDYERKARDAADVAAIREEWLTHNLIKSKKNTMVAY